MKDKTWAMIWGGAKRMGGGGMYQRTRPPEKFLDPSKRASGLPSHGFLYRKNRATTPEGVENVPYEEGPKPPSGRGVIREVFLPPSFFDPPVASSEKRGNVLTSA